MKNTIIVILIVVLGIGCFVFIKQHNKTTQFNEKMHENLYFSIQHIDLIFSKKRDDTRQIYESYLLAQAQGHFIDLWYNISIYDHMFEYICDYMKKKGIDDIELNSDEYIRLNEANQLIMGFLESYVVVKEDYFLYVELNYTLNELDDLKEDIRILFDD